MVKALANATLLPDSMVFVHDSSKGTSASSTPWISFVLTRPLALAHSNEESAICLGAGLRQWAGMGLWQGSAKGLRVMLYLHQPFLRDITTSLRGLLLLDVPSLQDSLNLLEATMLK